MDAGTLIFQQLTASAAVGALCAGRVFPVRVPQGQRVPAVCYTLVSRTPQQFILNQRAYDQARAQVSVFADTYAQVVALADACRAALDGYRVGDEVATVLEIEIDHFEDGADRFHRSQDYRLNLPSPF